MSQTKPIVIDIEVKRGQPIVNPPIAIRLMKMKLAEVPPTLENIQGKMLRAESLRNLEIARKAQQLTD